MEPFFPHEVRSQLRAQMAGVVPAEHVDEVVDLAIHAAESARETLVSVALRASDPRLLPSILSPAFGLLEALAGSQVAALRQHAADNGMVCNEGRIVVG